MRHQGHGQQPEQHFRSEKTRLRFRQGLGAAKPSPQRGHIHKAVCNLRWADLLALIREANRLARMPPAAIAPITALREFPSIPTLARCLRKPN